MARVPQAAPLGLDEITVEGALIAPAMLARIVATPDNETNRSAYRIPGGLTLRDEIARYFRIGQDLFRRFFPANVEPSLSATIRFGEHLLRDVFRFSEIVHTGARTLDDRVFPVTLEAYSGRVPVIVVPPADDLDKASLSLSSDRRRSAATALQDWLNANDDALWGLCLNGETVRLTRDNASLTRPAYIEANLRHIFENDAFADFTALWLLLHASRFGRPGTPPTDCALERWREEGAKEGVSARNRLRDGVEEALKALGTGFLADQRNAGLRERLLSGELSLPVFFTQLLRLVYRLIFLLTAEDRDLLHPPDASVAAKNLYAKGYSLSRLRDRAIRRTARDAHHDAWQGLLIVFAALANGEKRIGLPALEGMFRHGVTPDLDSPALPNRALMEAIFRLAWLGTERGGLARVNWRDMQTEELGSVYESLLELTPRLAEDGRALFFAAAAADTRGNARKTTGSYYTPDALVQTLLDSALEPVLDRAEAEADDPAAALLSVRVIDPACGSGHFLLAAAGRIATRLARVREGGVASDEGYRHALRDVTRACIHGVDRNPMAVELTKAALWIETVDPGKPLGFLDANIRCGDSLVGVSDLKALEKGIPEAAYKPLTGDDKATARFYAQRNKADLQGQGGLDFVQGGGKLPPAAPLARAHAALRLLPEDTPSQIAEKRQRYEVARSEGTTYALGEAADLYIAAFLLAKTGGPPCLRQLPMVPTTADVWRAFTDQHVHPPLLTRAVEASRQARAFHWPLEFPDVMMAGGFDAVLGNPPWERIKLQEQEFFASRDEEIANAPNAAARGRLIAALAKSEPGSRQRTLHDEFEAAKRLAEASSVFAREGGRFPLTGRGDVNTYALFAELFDSLTSPRGRAGVIVPTGIATDATTAPFFAALIENSRLVRLVDFENRAGIFPAIDSRIKFSLLTIGRNVLRAEFAFFLTDPGQWAEPARRFTLSSSEIILINPKTRNCPTFRSKADAQLTKTIYQRVPTFGLSTTEGGWGPEFFKKMFDFGIHANLLEFSLARPSEDHLPVYEAKMIGHFNHRFSTYEGVSVKDFENGKARDATHMELENPRWEITPRCWVHKTKFAERMKGRNWSAPWILSMRDVTNATNERTAVFSIRPFLPANDKLPSVFVRYPARNIACLVANLSSLTFDYIARQKVGGTNFGSYLAEQLPVLPPSFYTPTDLAFIVPRVLELACTSQSMAPFACDLGYEGSPFAWDEDRRAHLRADLDAFYARAYGLTRDELRYILDPADALGPDYPSETFRVLKQNEIRRYSEYRTARLVLAAWDRMAAEAKIAAA